MYIYFIMYEPDINQFIIETTKAVWRENGGNGIAALQAKKWPEVLNFLFFYVQVVCFSFEKKQLLLSIYQHWNGAVQYPSIAIKCSKYNIPVYTLLESDPGLVYCKY